MLSEYVYLRVLCYYFQFYMYFNYTYVLLLKEVILGLLTRAAHILQKRSHVPLPVIHICDQTELKVR